MAKNISKLFGTPSTLEGGRKQHSSLVRLLKANEVFAIPFMNRGWLVLRHEVKKMYPSSPSSKTKVHVWRNYLQSGKPTGKYLKATKV